VPAQERERFMGVTSHVRDRGNGRAFMVAAVR
jgi:hypothetical protein